MVNRHRILSICATMGLGFCWCAEEILTFCMPYNSYGLGIASETSYLYIVYLPVFSLCAIALLASRSLEKSLATVPVISTLSIAGIFGILIVALTSQATLPVIAGVALFAMAAVALNYVWVRALSSLGGRMVSIAVVVTSGMTCAATLLWQLQTSVLLLFAAGFFATSFVLCLPFLLLGKTDPDVSGNGVAAFSGARHPAALFGASIVAMGFGFLQYTAYHYSSGAASINETVAHAVALALLVLVVFVLKDSDHTLSIKLTTTLMLFAYVTFSVMRGSEGLAFTLAAGTEGMFELVMLLAIAGLIERGAARPGLLVGGYALILGVSQLAGCVLSIVEHAVIPSDSYSVVGLLLVALLIIAAVWLLNEKTLAEFLWSGSARAEEGESPQHDDAEKTQDIAQFYGLTPRETEVLELLGKGRSSSFIAEHFCVSNNTVRSHVLHIYNKLNVHSRQELITLIDDWTPGKTA